MLQRTHFSTFGTSTPVSFLDDFWHCLICKAISLWPRILRRSLAQTFDRDVNDYLGLLGMYESATGQSARNVTFWSFTGEVGGGAE